MIPYRPETDVSHPVVIGLVPRWSLDLSNRPSDGRYRRSCQTLVEGREEFNTVVFLCFVCINWTRTREANEWETLFAPSTA